jgi:hypothetical protein
MSDAQRCEPPEHLRGKRGPHILTLEGPDGGELYWLWIGHVWLSPCDIKPVSPQEAYARGLRYLAPVAPPDLVRALVEALEGVKLQEHSILGMHGGDLVVRLPAEAFSNAAAALHRAKEAGV